MEYTAVTSIVPPMVTNIVDNKNSHVQ